MKLKNLLKIFFILILFGQCITPKYFEEEYVSQAQKNVTRPVGIPIFFESYISGGYSWAYPETSSVVPTDKYAYEGEVSVMFKLDSSTWSGGAVYFGSHDLRSIREKGALVFYMKAEYGGQNFRVELRDSKRDGRDVATAVAITEKTAKDWKKVVVPLVKFADSGTYWDGTANQSAPFDWSDVDTLGIAIGPMNNPFILYVDNAQIVSEIEDEKVKKEVEYLSEIKKMYKEPEKYLEKVVIADFDKSVSGWESLGPDFVSVKDIRYEKIEESKIDPKNREGHGKGVLALDVEFAPSSFDKSAVKINRSENWKNVYFIEYELYIPEGAPDTLTAVPFIQSDGWRIWSQCDSFSVKLKPGEWVKVRYSLEDMGNVKKDDINAFGTFVWGPIPKPYKGPIYIDNWIKYGKNIKEWLPTKLPKSEIEKMGQKFTPIDISKAVNMGFYDEKEGDGKGGWTDQGENDLREFKFTGKTVLGNVEFYIVDPEKNNGKSCIVLRGQNNRNFPTKVEIPVENYGAGIYFLHNAAWSFGIVGRYIIVYEDNTEHIIYLRDGKEIFNWWGPGESDASYPGWIGDNPVKKGVGLNIYAWVNPYPNKKIKKIIAETDGDKAFLMLVAATLTDKGPFVPEIEEEKIDMSKWFKFEGIDVKKLKGSPLDVSFLLDKPAGKYGFIKTKGDKFVFENGKEIQFWGINVVASANFVDKPTADIIADRLACMGVNIVRHHHIDADWSYPNIFGNKNSTKELDKDALDKFDYLWAKLTEKGIYHYLDLLVNRIPKPGDGIESPEDITAGYKIEGEFVDYLIELQKEFAKQILLHKNPYTGKTLVEDPSLVMMELINEDSLFWMQDSGKFAINTPYYKKIWQRLFNEWLVKNFNDRKTLEKRWAPEKPNLVGLKDNEDPQKNTVEFNPNYREMNYSIQRIKDTYKFVYDTQEKYFTTMVKFLRSIGVKCLITGSNHWVEDVADLYLNAKLGYVDRHQYWAHPEGGYGLTVKFYPEPMVRFDINSYVYGLPMMGILSVKNVYGRPFIITEWQNSIPNQYVIEGQVIMPVYCRLKNWNAIQFAFSHSSYFGEKLESNFDVHNHPGFLALWPVSSLIFHRKDIMEADKGFFFKLTEKEVLDPFLKVPKFSSPLSFVGKWGLMFPEIYSDELYDKNYSYKKFLENFVKDGVITSVTKEILWDSKKGIFKFDTPRSQGVVGFVSDTPLAFKDMEIKIKTEFAAVVLTSLTDKPIKDSDNLLLTTVARVRHKGMKYDAKGRLVEIGSLPVLIEPVEGNVVIKSVKPIKVYKLSPSGEQLGTLNAVKTEKGYEIVLSANNKCMYYLIKR